MLIHLKKLFSAYWQKLLEYQELPQPIEHIHDVIRIKATSAGLTLYLYKCTTCEIRLRCRSFTRSNSIIQNETPIIKLDSEAKAAYGIPN